MVNIRFFDIEESYVGFQGEMSVLMELKAEFSFYANGYRYDKRFKMGYWDGKISMIKVADKRFLKGLLPLVLQYCDEQEIEYQDDTTSIPYWNVTDEQGMDFYRHIKGPFEPYDTQLLAFVDCINKSRNIILAPTSNGKSYIIHGVNAYHALQKRKVLLMVDRADLVLQLQDNFVDEYNSNDIYSTSVIYDEKGNFDIDSDVLITTWQSIYKKPKKWFEQFDVIIGDEVHKFKAKSLQDIFDKCGHIQYRHGFTATLDNDSKVDKLVLMGMFGEVTRTATLKELIDAGQVARPTIYAIKLVYPSHKKKALREAIDLAKKSGKENPTFEVESDFIENDNERLNFIANLESRLKGNTLIAFKKAEHGKAIFDLVKQQNDNVFFANYTVSKKKRHEIIKAIKQLDSSTGVVSLGTFSTGINIPNINNLIVATQVKSKITVPQLIGRTVRLSEGKTESFIYDIGDDLTNGKWNNIFLNHWEERLELYVKEGFKVIVKEINLN